MTIEALADLIGISKSALARIETGESELKSSRMKALALALHVDQCELLQDPNRRPVPIVGVVGAGGEIWTRDQVADWFPEGTAQCPRDLNPDDTEALVVVVDTLMPIEQGSVIFTSRPEVLQPEEMLRRVCVVSLDDGRRILTQVRRGYEKGAFNVIQPGSITVEDVQIKRAAKIRAIIPPDKAREYVGSLPGKVAKFAS